MAGASHGDVTSTLGELERKLKDLERELQTAGGAPAVPALAAVPPAPVAPPPAVAPPPPAAVTPSAPEPPAPAWSPPATEPPPHLVAEARASLGGLQGQLHELHRFREQLERSARELMDEYSRVLDALGADPGASAAPDQPLAAVPRPPAAPPAPAPAPAVAAPIGAGVVAQATVTAPAAPPEVQAAIAPVPPPSSSATAAGLPPSYQAPLVDPPPGAETPGQPTTAAPAPAPVPDQPIGWTQQAEHDATVSGQVTVDAGPFADIATLSAFEQALGRVPGAQDVYVRGFEGNRALIDVQLASPVALGAALRQSAPMAFDLTQLGPGQIQVTIDAA